MTFKIGSGGEREPYPDPDGFLTMDTELVDIPYMSKPNPDWQFTDAEGHRHYRVDKAADPYPTLEERYGPSFWCADCHDEHDDWLGFFCKLCGERIRTGMTGPGVDRIPGMRTYKLDGAEITEARFMELLAQRQTAKEEALRAAGQALTMRSLGYPPAFDQEW